MKVTKLQLELHSSWLTRLRSFDVKRRTEIDNSESFELDNRGKEQSNLRKQETVEL
jgi:hypothetical protein